VRRLQERLTLAGRALDRLAQLVDGDASDEVRRDAAILRFESGFEAVWKAAQRYLLLAEGVAVNSPKAVLRGCRDAGHLEDTATEHALEMADDRNLTVHTYNEGLAQAIYSRLPRHHALMVGLVRSIRAALDEPR